MTDATIAVLPQTLSQLQLSERVGSPELNTISALKLKKSQDRIPELPQPCRF